MLSGGRLRLDMRRGGGCQRWLRDVGLGWCYLSYVKPKDTLKPRVIITWNIWYNSTNRVHDKRSKILNDINEKIAIQQNDLPSNTSSILSLSENSSYDSHLSIQQNDDDYEIFI